MFALDLLGDIEKITGIESDFDRRGGVADLDLLGARA